MPLTYVQLAMAGIALALILYVAAHTHTYSAKNAGAYIDLPFGHWCGIEVKGARGVFCDVE